MAETIFLDNNATTKISDIVWQKMLPYFQHNYANASSVYQLKGREANSAIQLARTSIATELHCQEKELIFTSGATESINMALRGVWEMYSSLGKKIITTKTEHKAVLTCLEYLEKKHQATIVYVDVDKNGLIDLSDLQEKLSADTILVAIMAANNETGVVQDFHSIAQLCQQAGVLYFCDATQLFGKIKLDLTQSPIDLLCLSAHKIHGPKGAGCLYVRRKSKPIQIEPLIFGGGQENGLRGGTYNTSAIVGFGAAVEDFNFSKNIEIAELRDYFEEKIQEKIPKIQIHGQAVARLPNTSYITFEHVLAAEIITHNPHLALSSGSACVTGNREPSHVLLTMGVSKENALGAVRFSLSKFTTRQEIDICIKNIVESVAQIRANSPVWQMFIAGLL